MYTYNYTSAYTYDYNRLPLIKICLCFFLDMHLFSKNLSTIATISALIMSELFPAFLVTTILFYHRLR